MFGSGDAFDKSKLQQSQDLVAQRKAEMAAMRMKRQQRSQVAPNQTALSDSSNNMSISKCFGLRGED